MPKTAKVCIEHFSQGGLAWCDYARPRLVNHRQALAIIRPTILEYEAWLAARRGDIRSAQLKTVANRTVKRAVGAWKEFVAVQ